MCWMTDVNTIHSPIEGMLPSTGITLTLFPNLVSKATGLQGATLITPFT